MTILERPQLDIADSSRRLTPYRPSTAHGIDYFSPQAFQGDWQRWYDWLAGILFDREAYEDDLATAPTADALRLALLLIRHLERQRSPAPDTAAIGPNGEIILERRHNVAAEQIVVYDDLRVDWFHYANGVLLQRETLMQE